MTVICFDGTTLAVDSLCVMDEYRTHTDKLFKFIPRGEKEVKEVVAICGNLDICMTMYAKYTQGVVDAGEYLPQNEETKSYLVILSREGLYWLGEGGYPVKINDPIFALGSGAGIALGAMHCGKSAIEAAEIACLYDINCGGKILSHAFLGPVDKKVKK